ncbi:alpha/beta hydrolase [Marinitenerispora sediminis]|uniref:Alpha/beta hydrolase n=1 Tax=Marinitenerispora sediminis TaxID=1931232 RepID=A0A368SYI3_9ACTN|nr:alpha/beta hydrolase [Marinitenerispora sediminis]RCV48220.1 alpha/beta hydrolase [Marinitenerispora sediminis]RCV49079.1 alpha/beta hydrolase [Marinitenerispora sediminis]RCV49167.1 alpha/beta hydrolase [Marinitenerispora sediminis]
MALDRSTALVLKLMTAAYPDLGRTVTEASEARRLHALARFPEGPPMAGVREHTIAGSPDIPVRIYHPHTGRSPRPVLVYFHGGGFVLCGLDSHDGICRLLADGTGAVVVSVDYRRAPEHRFPAAVDDAYAAVRWVHRQAAELGADPARVAVAGDSAGGNLAAVACLLARERGTPPIAFQLLIYPVTDIMSTLPSRRENADGCFLTATHLRWFHEQYLTSPEEAAHPHASPLRAPSLADLPPALVVTAEYDPLRDEGEAYAARLAAAGVPAAVHRADGLFHGFFGMSAMLPAARATEHAACAALRAALVRDAPAVGEDGGPERWEASLPASDVRGTA